MSMTPRLSSVLLAAALVLLPAIPAEAWNTARLTAPTPLVPDAPVAPDIDWVRNLGTHEWIMWQAIEYLRRQNYPLAELFAQNFDALAHGNHYADHNCDGESGIPDPGNWIWDDRLGKPIEQLVELVWIDQAAVANCADVVTHFPMRAEVGHVEEIWEDVNGDDIFAPTTAAQEYATKLLPSARAFLPGAFQPGASWDGTQPQLAALPWVNLGSYRPEIRILAPDADETPLGSVRVGAVPRESPPAWPPFVANPVPGGHRANVAPQDLGSAMFYLGWVAHLVGDSAQYYHRQRVSGPFHGGFEGDVDNMIHSGAFDAGAKRFPLQRTRALVLKHWLTSCHFIGAACENPVTSWVNGMTEAELYAEAASLGMAAPQTTCAVPFDPDATADACAATPSSFAQYTVARALGGAPPTMAQIIEAAAGPVARAPCRCTEWSSEAVWMDYMSYKGRVGAYGQSAMPIFNGSGPSREMLAAYAADNLSRGITATATLFMVYGDQLLAGSAGNSLVFDGAFYQAANGDVPGRAGGNNPGALLSDWLARGLREGRPSSPAFDVRHLAAVTSNPLVAGFDGLAAPRVIGNFLASGGSPTAGTSPAFNAAHYRALNPDLGPITDVAAMRHFAGGGVDAGRIGSLMFDARAYRARYADVAGLSPRAALAQWVTTGLAAGRVGSPGFDPSFYLQANPDVAAAVASDPVRGLRHFAFYGVHEPRQTSPAFDVRFYGAVHGAAIDAASLGIPAGGTELAHWLRAGLDAGLAASPAFDPVFYRASNPDLALASSRAAVDQFLAQGIKDGRPSSPFFDVRYYLAVNPDLAAVYQVRLYNPVTRKWMYRNDYEGATLHWLRTGIGEGRRASAGFDPTYYRTNNPAVAWVCGGQASPNLCAMTHFARTGKAQGLLPVRLPDTVGAASLGTASDVVFSYGGAIPGLTCVATGEAADPDGWSDNYLCSVRDLGLRWSSAGPIAGMACTAITEPSDPYTWNDNYLCAPASTPMGYQWSFAGPIAGKRCAQFLEPGDPHTWNDNYLCR